MQVLHDYIDQITPESISLLPYQVWVENGCSEFKFDPKNFMELYTLRGEYIKKIGFPIYTEETVATLRDYLIDMRVIDVGAGSGFLAKILEIEGVAITAIDSKQTTYAMGGETEKHWEHLYKNDIEGDAVEYLKFCNNLTKQGTLRNPPDAIIMSWPDLGSLFASRIAQGMIPGQILIYQGEGQGGCTGNDEFHDLINDELKFEYQEEITSALNLTHAQFQGIHDRWEVYKKL